MDSAQKKKKSPPSAQGANQTANLDNAESDYNIKLDERQELNKSEIDKEVSVRFTPKRVMVLALADSYAELAKDYYGYGLPASIIGRANRVRSCGDFLEFLVSADSHYLHRANFCADKLCPMCNWRRSLKMFSQMSRVMDWLEGRGYQFLFLTLTVRNCNGAAFKDTVSEILSGWKRMSNRAPFRAFRGKSPVVLGSARFLETTVHYSKTGGSYHPHLHAVLAVKPDYFKNHYIGQASWVQYWRKAMGLDYDPIVHIEKIQPGKDGSYGKAVAEVSKYPYKASDWYRLEGAARLEVVRRLYQGVSGRRFTGFTGCFRDAQQALRLADAEDGDLVHTDVDQLRPDVAYLLVRARWQAGAYLVQSVADEDAIAEAVEDIRRRNG